MKLLLILLSIIGLGLIIFMVWANIPALPKKIYKEGQLLFFPSPPSPTASVKIQEVDTIKVMTYNIGFGAGEYGLNGRNYSQKWIKKNIQELKKVIQEENPDILAVQEIDIRSNRSYNGDQVTTIAKSCGFPYVAIAYTWDKQYVPYPLFTNPKLQFGKILAGQAIFSKYPITKQEIVRFKKPRSNNGFYNLFYIDRVMQTVTITPTKNQTLLVSNIHLEAYDKNERAYQAKIALEFLENKPIPLPQILLGDFNAVDAFTLEKRPNLTQTTQKEYESDKTMPTLRQAHLLREVLDKIPPKDHKDFGTYPASKPEIRLDYIFYHPRLTPLNVNIPNSLASDHKPLTATFKLP